MVTSAGVKAKLTNAAVEGAPEDQLGAPLEVVGAMVRLADEAQSKSSKQTICSERTSSLDCSCYDPQTGSSQKRLAG
jgi:hypothetical protein